MVLITVSLMAAAFVPPEAMLVRDTGTGKVSMQPCPTRGAAYLKASRALNPAPAPSTHMKGGMHHHKNKAENPLPCPQALGGPLAPIFGQPSAFFPERIAQPVHYALLPNLHFKAQALIRQANRGPPRRSAFL